jgi:hypothetical protein
LIAALIAWWCGRRWLVKELSKSKWQQSGTMWWLACIFTDNYVMSISEETVSKVLSMLPDCPTVEQLMETGQFDSGNTIRSALRILKERGQINAEALLFVALGGIRGPTCC